MIPDSLGMKGEGVLLKIQDFTQTTAENTSFHFWSDGLSLVAIAGLIMTIIAFVAQNRTASNTMKLTRNAQRDLLLDLVRHLYRNFVITYTIQTKLQDIEFKGYPSEEHLIKLKIPMENIHLEAFYGKNREREYQVMNNLYLNFRNYNNEIDVACEHLKNPAIPNEVKLRDFSTLLFKPSYLTERILITLYEIWGQKGVSEDFEKPGYRQRVCEKIVGSQVAREVKTKIREAQNGNTNASNNVATTTSEEFAKYESRGNSYARLLFTSDNEWQQFLLAFNHDVQVERGHNEQGGEKVCVIRFQ